MIGFVFRYPPSHVICKGSLKGLKKKRGGKRKSEKQEYEQEESRRIYPHPSSNVIDSLSLQVILFILCV